MIPISPDSIQAWSGGGSALSNGKALSAKGQLFELHIDAGQSLIWGLCQGSGSKPYSVSADFSEDPQKPIFRCSCPSKQIPCKHAIGLLFAWLKDQEKFTVEEIPEEIASKRDKREQAAQKKAEKAAQPEQPKKVNVAAQTKKIAAQLEGLDMLDKILRQLVDMGLSAVSTETLDQLEQQSKQLGAYYLPGAQNGLWELIYLLMNEAQKNDEGLYQVMERLLWLQNLFSRGSAYLKQRLENRELPPDTSSPIEEWLGKVWQLQELRELNQVRENVDLLQLSFGVFYDHSKRESVDLGLWVIPGESAVWETRNYRPAKASSYVKEEDSENRLLTIATAYLYPGGLNRRLRWESYTPRDTSADDISRVLDGAVSIKKALYVVKDQIKNPLSEKSPAMLVRAERVIIGAQGPVLVDQEGQHLVLTDLPKRFGAPSIEMVKILPQSELENLAVLLKFAALPAENRLLAQPLALVGERGVTRLV